MAVPGTVVFLSVLAYFAMLKSDERVRERERLAAGGAPRREELDDE